MKTLGQFKSVATRLRKQIAKTKELVIECEVSFYNNPCSLTDKALSKAENKLQSLEERLENTVEMIDHYDFYQRCWEEEQSEAMDREFYFGNPIMY